MTPTAEASTTAEAARLASAAISLLAAAVLLAAVCRAAAASADALSILARADPCEAGRLHGRAAFES